MSAMEAKRIEQSSVGVSIADVYELRLRKDRDGFDLVSGDFLRTIPGVHPCDGFFAAILQKD